VRWTADTAWEAVRWRTTERRPCARNLIAVEEKGGGDGGEPHQLQEVVAEGRTWSGNGGEQPAEEVLSGVDVADSGASK
jgi:hypothetical protein